jgi:hypothetical protein
MYNILYLFPNKQAHAYKIEANNIDSTETNHKTT